MASTWIKNTHQEGTIETGSAMRVWWLSRFQNCKVTEVRMKPQEGMFGHVSYRKVWILKPRQEETS